MGITDGGVAMMIQEIVPEGGLETLLRFTNPLVVVGPPFEVSVGVRNTNKRKPIQIQYVFEYFDSYGRKTTQNTDWNYYSLPASVEMQLSGVSIAESTKSWRLRIRPAK